MGDIVQTPQVMHQRVPVVDGAQVIVEGVQEQFIDPEIQMVLLIDEVQHIHLIYSCGSENLARRTISVERVWWNSVDYATKLSVSKEKIWIRKITRGTWWTLWWCHKHRFTLAYGS